MELEWELLWRRRSLRARPGPNFGQVIPRSFNGKSTKLGSLECLKYFATTAKIQWNGIRTEEDSYSRNEHGCQFWQFSSLKFSILVVSLASVETQLTLGRVIQFSQQNRHGKKKGNKGFNSQTPPKSLSNADNGPATYLTWLDLLRLKSHRRKSSSFSVLKREQNSSEQKRGSTREPVETLADKGITVAIIPFSDSLGDVSMGHVSLENVA